MKKFSPIPILIISILAIPLFSFSFLYYLIEIYLPFIHDNPDNIEAYLASAHRFTCRLGYIVSFIGLLRMQRWGFYLLVAIWISQLLPALIYSVINDMSITGHLYSAIQLLIYLAVVLPYWKKLKPIHTMRYISIFLITSIALHTLIYAL